MKRRTNRCFALLLAAGLTAFVAAGAQAQKARKPLTDDQIRKQLVKDSLKAYTGACPCPESRNDSGQRCGRNSAYLRSGGEDRPLCYPSNVSDTAIKKYRDEHPSK